MYKLEIELVPKGAWFKNLRSFLTRSQWDKIRKSVYKKAHYKCEICGGRGHSHPVECHEVWSFEEGKIRLIGLIALCPQCHQAKHCGLANIRGKGEEVIRHLMKVNNIHRKEAEKQVEDAFALWRERNKTEYWELDVDWLYIYLEDLDNG